VVGESRRRRLARYHTRHEDTHPSRRTPGHLEEHDVRCFILSYRQPWKKGEIVALIASTLDEMERKFAETPRPFIYTISKNDGFREYVRGPGA
jgi:hypothetical protein